MPIFTVNTGVGYFRDLDGNIVSKAELPKGEHPVKDGYTYTEVASKEELDDIIVYVPPPIQEELEEQMIWEEVKRIGKNSLKEQGKL